IASTSELFPEPLVPTTAVIWPEWIWQSTPSSTTSRPRRTRAFRASMSASPGPVGAAHGPDPCAGGESDRAVADAPRSASANSASGRSAPVIGRPRARPTSAVAGSQEPVAAASSPASTLPVGPSAATWPCLSNTRQYGGSVPNSSRRCSISKPAPGSCCSSAPMAPAPAGSSNAVGSSSRSSSGSATSAAASATRCPSPPDSSLVRRPARWLPPTARSAAATLPGICAAETARFSRAKATSSATVGRHSWSAGSWPSVATRAASSGTGTCRGSAPHTPSSPVTSASMVCGTTPAMVRNSVDFHDPDGPSSSTRCPGPTAILTCFTCGSAAAGYCTLPSSARSSSPILVGHFGGAPGAADGVVVQHACAGKGIADHACQQAAQEYSGGELQHQAQFEEVLACPTETDQAHQQVGESRRRSRSYEHSPAVPPIPRDGEGRFGAEPLDEAHQDQHGAKRGGQEDHLDDGGDDLHEDAHARFAHDVHRERGDHHPAADQGILRQVPQRPHQHLQPAPYLDQGPVEEAEHHRKNGEQHQVVQSDRTAVHAVSPLESAAVPVAAGEFSDTLTWLVTCRVLRPTSCHPPTTAPRTSARSPSNRVAKCSDPDSTPRLRACSMAA